MTNLSFDRQISESNAHAYISAYDVRIIGDAVSVGLVGPAVRAGYLTARQI